MSHDPALVAKVAEALRGGSTLRVWSIEDAARAVLAALDLPGRERRAKAEARRAEWRPDEHDGRNWRFPAEQVAATVVTDAILRDVLQGRKDHLRGQMLDVARRRLGRIEWARDEDIRKAQAEALREFAEGITVQTAARIVEDMLARAAELDPEEKP